MRREILVAAALLSATPAVAWAKEATATYAQPLSSQAVQEVQGRLHSLGYYSGTVDGAWGPSTRAALERFQRSKNLAVTGELNQATVTAMGLDPDRLLARGYEPRAASPAERQAAVAPVGPQTTMAVQRELRRRGFYHGAVDGVWGQGTQAALQDFERSRRLAVTTKPSRDALVAMGINPDAYMTGSSTPSADRLNREELQRQER